jgi:hypothetical protein
VLDRLLAQRHRRDARPALPHVVRKAATMARPGTPARQCPLVTSRTQ